MDNGIFMRMHLVEKVKLEPAFISKNYRDEVLKRLKVKVEGICTRHGFIKPDSVEIYKVCCGRIELIGLNGNTVFDVHFTADVCNPLLGSVVRCRVANVNKFGILAEAGSIIEAIVAKNSVNILSDVDLERIRIGDEVMVEVVGKKYELNEKKISLIGKIVKNIDLTKTLSMVGGNKQNDEDVEDEEEIEPDVQSLDGESASGSDSDHSDKEDDEDDEEDELEEDDEVSDTHSVKDDGNFFDDDDEFCNSDVGSDIEEGEADADAESVVDDEEEDL